jgi:hypothetical protein
VYGSEERQYFYVLDAPADEPPRFVAAGVSRLATTETRGSRAGYFGAPRVSGQTAFATRFERSYASGTPLPMGRVRVLLDRFELDGDALQTRPVVNVPGRPLLRLDAGGAGGRETWVSLEALPGDAGLNRLHRLTITDAAGAGSASAVVAGSWDLPASLGSPPDLFYGLSRPDLDVRLGTSSDEPFAAVVIDPADGCGETQLVAIGLGRGDDAGRLSEWGRVALPSDGWQSVSVEADRVLLRRSGIRALFQLSAGAAPALVSVR